MPEREKRKIPSRLAATKRDGFSFAEGAEFTGAALDGCAGDLVGESGGASAGADRIRKNM